LSSDALQHGPSPLHFFIPIPGGCEKEEEVIRIKIKQERRIVVLSFIVFLVNSITLFKREMEFFKTYRNDFKKSKIKGEG
jgi:hypothetical protein